MEKYRRNTNNEFIILGLKGLLSIEMKDVEADIIKEIESGNYQTLQQIADMIQEKFGIKVSKMAVSRLLKKWNPQAESRFLACQGRCSCAA